MAILTTADIPLYFPCSDFSDQQVLLLFRQAQTIAEGPLGSDRPLESTSFTEQLWMGNNTALLNYAPVAVDPAPVVKVRYGGQGRDSFGRDIPTGEWITLAAGQYTLNATRGEILITEGLTVQQTYSTAHPYSYGGNPYQAGYDPVMVQKDTAVEVTYTAGYTFTGSLSYDAQRIKDSVAAIATYISGPTFSGIAEIRTQREGSVKYGRESATPGLYGSGAGQVPEGLLIPLRKYRARGVGLM